MPQAAKFFLKVYDRSGASFRQTIPAERVISVPSIVREVGMPGSDLTVDLALPWDGTGLGEADGINYSDLVRIYAVNPANPGGVLVFQGFVIEVRTAFTATENRASVRLFPLEAVLADALFKSGPSSWTHAFSAKTAAFIIGSAVDAANALQGGYFTKNLADDGSSITATLDFVTHLEAIQAAAGFLDDTWYWRARPDGTVDLQQYADSVPTHRFTLGTDVDSLETIGSVLDLKNDVVVTWGSGPTTTQYQDSGSQAAYGVRSERIQDSAIQDLASANLAGNGRLSQASAPVAKSIVTVNAGYPIETIMPGDTMVLRNLTPTGAQIFGEGVVRILRVEYDGALARLSIGDVIENFGREITESIKATA